jgi:ketosteroid isomerase-like protein
MSENLDLVRSIFASWERGDFSSAEWADPDIEYVMTDGPMPGSWTGLADMAVAMRELLDAWEDYRVEADDFQEVDDERVLVILHARGRGKTSRLELDETAGAGRGANLFHVRDGKVVKLCVYWDRDRALADLGLQG